MSLVGQLVPTESRGYPLYSWENVHENSVSFFPATLSFPELGPAPSHPYPRVSQGLAMTNITGYKHFCPRNHDLTLICIMKIFTFVWYYSLIFCCFVFGLAKCFIFPKRKQKRNRKGDWVTDNGMLTEEETNKQKHWRSPDQKRGEDYLRQIAADAWLGLSCWVFQKANPQAHFLWGQDESVGLVFSSVSKYWARERKTRDPKTRWVKRMEEVFNRPFDAMKNLWDYKECEVLSFILCCSHIRVLKRN